jgi:hypothetical protein
MEPVFATSHLKFQNSQDLQWHFESLESYIRSEPQLMEIELKIHWTEKTLTKFYQTQVLAEISRLSGLYQSLSWIYSWPDCLRANGSKCCLSEATRCHAMQTLQRDYFVQIQKQSSGFSGRDPLSWWKPRESDLKKISQFLKNKDVLDFGCGNAYLSCELLKYGEVRRIHGVDVHSEPQFTHKDFSFHKTPIPTEALFCSMADHNMNVRKLIVDYKFKDLAFVSLSRQFGLGGHKVDLSSGRKRKLISWKELEAWGYELIIQESLCSDFDNAPELRLYSRKPDLGKEIEG